MKRSLYLAGAHFLRHAFPFSFCFSFWAGHCLTLDDFFFFSLTGFRPRCLWSTGWHQRLNHRQENQLVRKHALFVFGVWKCVCGGAFALMDRTRTLECEQGCCGTRLPTREVQVRVLYRLRGAAKHEDWSDSHMQPLFQHKHPSFKEKKKGGVGGGLQLRRTERHLFHKSWNWLWGISPTAAEVSQSAECPICSELPPPTRRASSSFNSILSLSSVLVLHTRLWRDVWSWRDKKTTAAVAANNDRNDARLAKTIWGHVEMLYLNWQDVGIN